MRRWGTMAAALLLIGSACASNFAKDNPVLCGSDKIQLVKDYVAKNGLTPEAAADKAGTDARCLSGDETTQAQATYAAFKASVTASPVPTQPSTATSTTAALSASASPSPSPTVSPSPTPSPTPTNTPTVTPTQASTAPPTQAPTATPTPTPTPSPSPSPTPSPSPSPTLAAGDGGWPTIVSHAIQSNEAPITGRVVHANGLAASHYCVILTSGPCAVTTDANGSFTTSFATLFLGPIDLVIKGPFNPATGDGPVQTVKNATMTAQGIQAGTITIP